VDQTAVRHPPPGSDWPQTWPAPTPPRRGGAAALACLIAAAVLCAAYALWAFTARRGIFADFSDGRAVTSSRARANDRIDTVLIVVAGLVAVVAVVWWVTHRVRRRGGSPAELGGFAVTALGIVIIGVGLSLAGTITDAAGRAAQGDRGVAAALVSGVGFAVLAVGLLLGAATVRWVPMPSRHRPVAQGYPPPQRPW
jgi:hypothetical protein